MRIKIFILLLIFVRSIFGIPILYKLKVDSLELKKIKLTFFVANPDSETFLTVKIFDKKTNKARQATDNKGIMSFSQTKHKFSLIIDSEELSSSLKNLKVIPKLHWKGRIYYEMIKVPQGEYAIERDPGKLLMVDTGKYFLSRYEISNEQFEAFVKADGYDTEKYWLIPAGLMKKVGIGWFYQGLKRMSLPDGWSYKNEPYYSEVETNLPEDPVTGVSWFEVNAFCNWMQVNIPTNDEILIVYNSVNFSTSLTDKEINFHVSEWLSSGVDPNGMGCGGCNEMSIFRNSEQEDYKYPTFNYKCPLYKNDVLGFRVVLRK